MQNGDILNSAHKCEKIPISCLDEQESQNLTLKMKEKNDLPTLHNVKSVNLIFKFKV